MSKPDLPPSNVLAQLLSTGPLGMVVLDADGRVSWANEVLLCQLDTQAEDLIGRTAGELGTPWLRQLAEQSEFVHVPEASAEHGAGGRWLHCRFEPRADGTGAIGHVLDFTEIKVLVEERDALKQKVAALDPIDPVTGLLNARGLQQALAPQVSRSRRYGNRLTVVLLRLGQAGEFDERYPGETGEAILTAVTQLLNEQLRWADFIAHLERDEFVLVLQETGAEDAAGLITKLRDALADLSLGMDMPVARFGEAEWHKGDDVGLLLRRARAQLDGLD